MKNNTITPISIMSSTIKELFNNNDGYKYLFSISEDKLRDISNELGQYEYKLDNGIKDNWKQYKEAFNEVIEILNSLKVNLGKSTLKSSLYTKLKLGFEDAFNVHPFIFKLCNHITYNNNRYERKSTENLFDFISRIKMAENIIKDKNISSDIRIIKSVEYAVKNCIDISDTSDLNEIFNRANEHAKNALRLNMYPDGTIMDHSYCDECSTWTIGMNRCSCGNRRMELIIEGDFINGFYAYPKPY